MCIFMCFKIQSEMLYVWNALKSQIFDLFTKSSSGHNKKKMISFYFKCLLGYELFWLQED